MASRPFASVDVALEVGAAEQTDLLRGSLEVGAVARRGDHGDLHMYITALSRICW